MQLIMVPHDGSDPSDIAQAVAEQLAQAQGAELVVVRALDQTDWYSSNLADFGGHSAAHEELVVASENSARNALADRVATLQARGMKARAVLVMGPPAACLLDIMADEQPDLVVMPSHGRTGLARFQLGSVTDRLVREGNAPVLVLRITDTEAHALRRAALMLDGSDVAEQALPLTEQLAGQPVEHLKLLRAVPKPDDRDAALTYLQGIAARLAGKGMEVEPVVEVGEPVEIAHQVGQELDLLILCTHGRGGFDRMRHGSVAERVIREVQTPTLLVRAAHR